MINKISEEGLEQVRNAFENAHQDEVAKGAAYNQAILRTEELMRAMGCDHSELEDASTEGIMQTRCKKCGFIWIE